MPKPPKDVVLSKKEIGARLRTLREQQGLAQSKLAVMIGTHAQSLWQIENGIRGITVQQVVKLARALRVSVDEILGEGNGHKPHRTKSGDARFLRRLRDIEELSRSEKQALLKTIDHFLRGARAARSSQP